MKKFVRSRVIREREINMISTNKAIAGVVLVTLLNGFIKVMLPGFEGLGKSATNAIDGLAAGLERAKKNAQIEFSSIKLLAGDAGAASGAARRPSPGPPRTAGPSVGGQPMSHPPPASVASS